MFKKFLTEIFTTQPQIILLKCYLSKSYFSSCERVLNKYLVTIFLKKVFVYINFVLEVLNKCRVLQVLPSSDIISRFICLALFEFRRININADDPRGTSGFTT